MIMSHTAARLRGKIKYRDLAKAKKMMMLRLRPLLLLCITSVDAFFPQISPKSTMPALFTGWFPSGASPISKGIVQGVRQVASVGKPVLVTFPSVPNFDEVAFGTSLNAKWGTMAASYLGMPAYKPGSLMKTYFVQFSNVYWAKILAEGLSATTYGIFNDGLKKDCVSKPGKLKIASLRKPETFSGIKKGDYAIVVSPGPGDWKRAIEIFQDQKLIFLNPQVNPTYELGAPIKGVEDAYTLKRVSKGWVFRCAPGSWEAYLEKPDSCVELLKTYKDRPTLRDISTFIREESLERYSVFNDRYAPGFGERL